MHPQSSIERIFVDRRKYKSERYEITDILRHALLDRHATLI